MRGWTRESIYIPWRFTGNACNSIHRSEILLMRNTWEETKCCSFSKIGVGNPEWLLNKYISRGVESCGCYLRTGWWVGSCMLPVSREVATSKHSPCFILYPDWLGGKTNLPLQKNRTKGTFDYLILLLRCKVSKLYLVDDNITGLWFQDIATVIIS